MDLSWEILSIVVTFLNKKELKVLRRVNKYWEKAITPLFCDTLIYDPQQPNLDAHRRFLKKHGACADKLVFGFLGLGNIFSLSSEEIAFLSVWFPRVSSLEFNIREEDPDGCALGLLALGQRLPRLEKLEIRGVLDGPVLKILGPLTNTMKALSIGRIVRRDGTVDMQIDKDGLLLPHLKIASAKELEFFEYAFTDFYSRLIQEFPWLDSVFYRWDVDHDHSWLLYDIQRSTIKQVSLPPSTERLSDVFEVSAEFDVEQIEPSRQAPLAQFQYIEGVFEKHFIISRANSELLQIKLLCLKFDEASFSRAYGFLSFSTAARQILLTLEGVTGALRLPETRFTAHRLTIAGTDRTSSALVWASKWFPNLTVLYFDAAIDEDRPWDHSLSFASLVRFYTNRVRSYAFWNWLCSSSKELKLASLAKEDPHPVRLTAAFPNIAFVYFSAHTHDHFALFDRSKYHFYRVAL